jgi:DNA-binding XRE family transcriptional regulator
MARDILSIPLAGVGVERVFNFARDMCHFRRGQLHPDTIRSLLLVYHSQIKESRIDQHQEDLASTIDIADMSQEEIENEIANRDSEINLRRENIDKWDQDHYISDNDEQPNATTRTIRMQLRTAYIARKQSYWNSRPQQSLSNYERRGEEARAQRIALIAEQNEANSDIWNISSDAIQEEERNENVHGEDITLPIPLEDSSSPSRSYNTGTLKRNRVRDIFEEALHPSKRLSSLNRH